MEEDVEKKLVIKLCVLGALLIVMGMFLLPAYDRLQDRYYASNKIILNEIEINQTQQLIEVEKRKALIRIEEARGIAESQKIIDKTLSDKYLQLQAINAQIRMAGSPNHTQIYIPTGQNGIPLIKTVDSDTVVSSE